MRPSVLIAFTDTGGEAPAVRAAAECFGANVFYYPIGRPADFLAVLEGKTGFPRPDIVVLSLHGEDGAFLMPELADWIYLPGEPRGAVGPEIVREHLAPGGPAVLSTACATGGEEMAAAFREKGVFYAAPAEEVEGSAALMFAVRFLYELLARGKTCAEAVGPAASADEETALFRSAGEGGAPC